MEIKKLFILPLIIALLTGCSKSTTTFYVECRKEGPVTYVTDGTNYYKETEIGLVKVPQDTMRSEPYIKFHERHGTYRFQETEIPTVYQATLGGLEIYITDLVDLFGGDCNIEYADSLSLRGTYTNDSFSIRFIYAKPNYLRLYAVDKLKNPIHPPYLNDNRMYMR